jgi:hypothetical protein
MKCPEYVENGVNQKGYRVEEIKFEKVDVIYTLSFAYNLVLS